MNNDTAIQKIKNIDAISLSKILGSCNLKNVGSDLFFPMMKLLSSLIKVTKEHQELHSQIVKELGIEINEFNGSFKDGTPIERINALSKSIKQLDADLVEISGLKILSNDDLLKLKDENPTLTGSSLNMLFEFMLKD